MTGFASRPDGGIPSAGEPAILPVARPEKAGIHAWIASVLDLVLGQSCLLCGDSMGRGEAGVLCSACAAGLPRLARERCPVCALPTQGGEVCGACLSSPPQFDATLAVYVYAYPVDRLIQALKYRHRLALSTWFGRELACLAAALAGPALVLPMPLHRRRLAERGFNQALELARPIGRLPGLELTPTLAERASNAVPQASLPWKERRRNIRGAFMCRQDLTGRHVVVVDDVMTTGATLDELAGCLKRRGAARVSNLVLARTLPHGVA